MSVPSPFALTAIAFTQSTGGEDAPSTPMPHR
jgi:hypothetical protein